MLIPSTASHAATTLNDATFTAAALKELFARLKTAHVSGGEGISFLPTFVPELPSASTASQYRGSACVLSLDATRVTAARVGFVDATFYVGRTFVADFTDGAVELAEPLPLHDTRVTATAVVNAIARVLRQLLKEEDLGEISPLPVTVSSQYSLELKQADCGSFFRFEEKCPLINEDPVEGANLKNLIEVGLERRELKVKVVGLCTAGTATLIAGAFERVGKQSNRCLISLSLDASIQLSYVDQKPSDHKMTDSLISVDYSHFQGTRIADSSESFKTVSLLPRMSADFMLDCMAVPTMEQLEFERATRLCCGIYLPELTRLLFVQLLRTDAPGTVYKPNSLPFKAFAAIVTDPSTTTLPNSPLTADLVESATGPFTAAKEVLRVMYSWNDREEDKFHMAAKLLTFAAKTVVRRAADLAATIVGAAAVKTGRLQPALGGVTVALAGASLATEWFRVELRRSLDKIFGRDTEQLMQFLFVENGDLKGAAIFNWQRQTIALTQ